MLGLVFLPLVAAAILVIVLPRRVAPLVAMIAMLASASVAVQDVRVVLAGGRPTALGGMLALDLSGAIILLLVLGVGFFAALVSSQTEEWSRRFFGLLLTFTSTMALAATADNLGLLWASVEATTLSSALLVGHRRTRQSTEAAWKYLILSSTGILFAFVATLVLVLAGRGVDVTTLSASALLVAAEGMDPGLLRLAIVLATVGYGTKAGIVPYHFWLPDAHSEAPGPVSALLSGVLLSCALLALDRFLRIGRAAGIGMEHLHLGLGTLSVLVGGALILAARTYKRMLAYSSIENMGLVAFALGVGTPFALAAAYLHVVSHGIAKSLAFFSAGRVHHHLETVEIGQARGLLSRTPAAGRGLLGGMIALAGVPPFGPFASKLMILVVAFQETPPVYAALLLFGLALAFMGFLRQISILMPHASAAEGEPPPAARLREPWTVPLALGLLVAFSIVVGLVGPAMFQALFESMGGLAP